MLASLTRETRPGSIRALAARIPRWLRVQRGRLLLRADGLRHAAETACPACGQTGWLDPDAFESCPVCRGFLTVPVALARWWERRVREMRSEP